MCNTTQKSLVFRPKTPIYCNIVTFFRHFFTDRSGAVFPLFRPEKQLFFVQKHSRFFSLIGSCACCFFAFLPSKTDGVYTVKSAVTAVFVTQNDKFGSENNSIRDLCPHLLQPERSKTTNGSRCFALPVIPLFAQLSLHSNK